jgi:hypothetical protein
MLNKIAYTVTRQKPFLFGMMGGTGYRFNFADGKQGFFFTDSGFADLNETQKRMPAVVLKEGGRTYWTFQGEVYWENDGYTDQRVLALLMDQRAKEKEAKRGRRW